MYSSKKQKHLTSKRSIQFRNYQKYVDIFINFVKSPLKDPKIKKLMRKTQKLTKKMRKGPILHLKRIIKFSKHCGIDFRWLHIHAASIKIHFYKKPSKKKIWAKWTKTRLKTVICMRQSLRNSFQSQRSITECSA